MKYRSNEPKDWKGWIDFFFKENQKCKYTRDTNGEIWRHALSNSSKEKQLEDMDLKCLVNNKVIYLEKRKKEKLLSGDIPDSEIISQYIRDELILDSTDTYRQSNAFEITDEHKKAIDDYFKLKTTRIHEKRDGKVFIYPKVYGSGPAIEIKPARIQDRAIQVLNFLNGKLKRKSITGPLPKRSTIKNYIINECNFSFCERVRAVQASTASQAGPSSAKRPRSPQADSVPKNTFDIYSTMDSKAVQDLDLLSSAVQQIRKEDFLPFSPPPKRRRR